jgi:hypothetical protein
MSFHHRWLLCLCFLGAVLCWSALLSPVRADEQADLKAKVNQLVQQLNDPDSEKQAAAAAALLKLGPDILPLLPKADAKLTATQKKHLQTLRSSLREAQALKGMVPSTITLQNNSIPLSEALKELAKQTGIAVMDKRRDQDADPRLNLDFNKTTFWEAVDDIATKADLRVYLYDRSGQVALIDGPHKDTPVTHNGVFRIAVKRQTAVRDLESEAHYWILNLEIAWEPRFQPLFLDTSMDDLVVQDAKGVSLTNLPSGSGRAPVTRPLVTETQVRVEAPERPTEKISLLKGSFTVVGPSQMLTFTFDNLAPIDRRKPEQTLKQTKEGVTVNLRELKVEPELWTFGFLLEYPSDGPEFESFESWLVNNKIFLVKKNGKEQFPENGGYEIDEQAGHKATLNYRFIEDNTLTLGKPADWKLVYRTPGTIIKVPVKFEFKDLPVP